MVQELSAPYAAICVYCSQRPGIDQAVLSFHGPCVVRILHRRIEQRLDLFRRQRIRRGNILFRCSCTPRKPLSRWIALCSAFFSAHYFVQFFLIQRPFVVILPVHCPYPFILSCVETRVSENLFCLIFSPFLISKRFKCILSENICLYLIFYFSARKSFSHALRAAPRRLLPCFSFSHEGRTHSRLGSVTIDRRDTHPSAHTPTKKNVNIIKGTDRSFLSGMIRSHIIVITCRSTQQPGQQLCVRTHRQSAERFRTRSNEQNSCCLQRSFRQRTGP